MTLYLKVIIYEKFAYIRFNEMVTEDGEEKERERKQTKSALLRGYKEHFMKKLSQLAVNAEDLKLLS